jgi:hypothetical protein
MVVPQNVWYHVPGGTYVNVIVFEVSLSLDDGTRLQV